MISKTRRYAILLIGTIFIGTAPHLADGLGWLVQGTSRITEETANRALVRHGQLISSPSPRQSAAGTDATQPAGIFRLHLATRFASCVTRTTSGKAILDIARAMQRQFDDLPGFAPLHRIRDQGSGTDPPAEQGWPAGLVLGAVIPAWRSRWPARAASYAVPQRERHRGDDKAISRAIQDDAGSAALCFYLVGCTARFR